MKQFCSERGCNQEVTSFCKQCRRILCSQHLQMMQTPRYDLHNQSLPVTEQLTTQYLYGWDRRQIYPGGGTYKAFYTQVLPAVQNIIILEQNLCRRCLEPLIRNAQKKLLNELIPVIEEVRRTGAMCTNNANVMCLYDSATLCQQCGMGRCTQHAAICEQCSQVFCCDAVSQVYNRLHYEAIGGCTQTHKHSFLLQVLAGKGNITYHWKPFSIMY